MTLTPIASLAERLCRQVLGREPGNVAGVRPLAEVGVRLGRIDEAESLLTWCLETAPECHLARASYATLLSRTLRLREALAEVQRVLEAEPDRPSHLLLKASILAQIGEPDESIKLHDHVLQQYPGHARTYLGKAHVLRTVGRHTDAVAACRKALEMQPVFGEAYWSLSNLKTFRFSEADVAQMRVQLPKASSPDDVIYLSFALGKALEDRGEFDESFRHYAHGNAARRRTVHWDANRHHEDVRRIAAFFQPEFLASRQGSGNASPAPIFIVGLPHAGSTLLEQILASHSRVEGTMELPDILSIVRRLDRGKTKGEKGFPQVLAELSASDLSALGAEYLERTAVHRSGAPHFIDKMPNNFPHIGLIHLLLPNARILDARRQPMACCFSVFKQLFAHGQHFSYSLEDIGRYYRDYIDLMAHWDAVLPGRVLRVDYEAVVENLEFEVRRILDFCELEFEPACLDFHRTERAVRTASSEQVREPLYKTAVEQWRNYEGDLAPLAELLAPGNANA